MKKGIACFFVLFVLPLSLFLFSCKDNVIGTVDPVTSDTIVKGDTIIITIRDTVNVPIGKAKTLLFAFVVADSADSTNAQYDSIHSALTAYSIPYVNSLDVSVNGHSMTYTQDQESHDFFEGFHPWANPGFTINSIAGMVGATYEAHFLDSATSYACTTVIPYYESAGDTALSYDTVNASIVMPQKIDSLVLSHTGVIYDSVDYFINYGLDTAYRILLDTDLEVSWLGNADWYAVQITKVLHDMFFGNYYSVSSMDTAVTDTQVVIPSSFFFQDTNYNSDTYSFLDIRVVPVNGPAPGTWDTLSAFDGNGYLFAFPAALAMATPNALPTELPQPKIKQDAVIPKSTYTRSSAQEVVGRVLTGELGMRQ